MFSKLNFFLKYHFHHNFQYITALKQEVLDHLRQIRHAPSVQMQQIPPDLLDPDEVH